MPPNESNNTDLYLNQILKYYFSFLILLTSEYVSVIPHHLIFLLNGGESVVAPYYSSF